MTLQHYEVIGSELALAWSDGSESYLSFEALRLACPCASCEGEPDVRGRVVKPQPVRGEGAFVLRGVQLVGGYALQFFWGDGHQTGLYAWSLLREIGAKT